MDMQNKKFIKDVTKFVEFVNKNYSNPDFPEMIMKKLLKESEYICEISGIPILHNQVAILSYGILSSMCLMIGGKDNSKVVLLDDAAMNFSEDTRNFIIYHEIGHLISSKIVPINQITSEIYPGFIDNEYLADKYSYENSGLTKDQCINSLKDLNNHMTYAGEYGDYMINKLGLNYPNSTFSDDERKFLKESLEFNKSRVIKYRINKIQSY